MRIVIPVVILYIFIAIWSDASSHYIVRGVAYEVMSTSDGFKQQGIASWYGEQFHGRTTSNMEVFDMHQMTAAHKTLPLPTYVLVRNLENGLAVIVRVNDRGPFIDDRIIDLSYAAAKELRMVDAGITEVSIEALLTPFTTEDNHGG